MVSLDSLIEWVLRTSAFKNGTLATTSVQKLIHVLHRLPIDVWVFVIRCLSGQLLCELQPVFPANDLLLSQQALMYAYIKLIASPALHCGIVFMHSSRVLSHHRWPILAFLHQPTGSDNFATGARTATNPSTLNLLFFCPWCIIRTIVRLLNGWLDLVVTLLRTFSAAELLTHLTKLSCLF